MPAPLWAIATVTATTLVGVAIGRLPRLRMNRATIALVGATALVLLGALDLEGAYSALDLDTLVLLLAMMILNANLRLAGFFQVVTAGVLRWARTPRQLLALFIVTSGTLSAVFLNDTIVLVMTPLVLEITTALRRNPIPYLVGLVTAANLGSVATVIGNPQNMVIGVASKIPFTTFSAALLPVAAVGLALAWCVLVRVYRRELAREPLAAAELLHPRFHRALLRKGLLASLVLVAALVAGLPIPLAALAAAALLLVTRRLKPERVFREIDVSLLVFFAGLFVVTGAIEKSGLSAELFTAARPLVEHGVGTLTATAAVLSNLVSNVPAVLLFRPVIPTLAEPERAWLVLAMATTLAGNLTLLGSVANLIVAETARSHRVQLSFAEYLKAGVPITLLSLLWGVAWLGWLR